MLQIERQNNILQWLHQKSFLSNFEVASHFSVSQMTVWRDIKQLEDQGLVKRVHGGIALPDWEMGSQLGDQHQAFTSEPVYHFPESLQNPRNIALGRYVASEIIQHGDDLILEGGSTVSTVIPFLQGKDVTIITNGLNTITLAQVYSTAETVLCCGGVLNQPNSIFMGPQAENFFHAYRADRTLVSAFGLTSKDGLVDPSPIYDSMKRIMCRSARQRIVMLDSEKIGRSALSRVMALSEIDILVTNQDANPVIINELLKRGLDVRLVE